MITTKNLTRAYGDFVAVQDVSFSIKAGEIAGLLGHNGAGKTTIMKMLSGYLEPSNGTILVDGIDLARDRRGVQSRLGYLPENLPVYPEMSVVDYLDYAARLKGLAGETCTREIRRVIQATDVTAKLLAPIGTLSRGYKQRVGVAQALLGQPKLLILDEPTNGLDPTQTQQMRALIKDISKTATVILSTHIMQEVDALCDRVLIMRNGVLAVDEQLTTLRTGHCLTLSTNLTSKNTVSRLLAPVNGVLDIDTVLCGDQQLRVQIKISDDVDLSEAAAEIAKTVVDSGHALFELAPAQRDLESVFREVNEKEELAHVA